MRLFVRICVGLLLVAVLVGCGRRSRSGAVTGTVTYKGQKVNDASLFLYLVGGDETQPITIPVTSDGSFTISDVPHGEYKIVVQGAEGGGSDASLLKSVPPDKKAEMEKMLAGRKAGPTTIPFPDKYKDLKMTDLKCQISDQAQKLTLELKD
jgi:hypothetical protein